MSKNNCVCCICGRAFYREPYRVKDYSQVTCSRQCSGKRLIIKNIIKLEQENNITSMKDWIYNQYAIELRSFREISIKLYKKSNRHSTIQQIINFYEIPIRRGSEAIKTQWLNNDKRRKEQAVRASIILGAGTTAREKTKLTMQTRESKKRQSLAKRGSRNPMYGIIGKNHPNWNPERTHEKRVEERKLFLDRQWRLSVFERDSYICQCCGYDKGGILVAHHLNGYHWDIENRYNVDNGVTLCEPCHIGFHGEYGYMNNTKEQFNEYMNQQLALL